MWKHRRAIPALEQLFDDVMGSAFGVATSKRAFEPSIDILWNEEELTILCDVPGIKLDDLDVVVEGRRLTIRGARKFEARENEQVMLGRAYGSFQRELVLPEGLDDEKLAASLADGVLTLRIPRLSGSKPRRIPVGGTKQLPPPDEGEE